MRKIEEIQKEIINLIAQCPGIIEKEIGKQLKLSPRFMKKILDKMIMEGKICRN